MRSLPRNYWPIPLAAFLYVVNNLAIWRGWIDPPAGYVPLGMNRVFDVAQYVTWTAGFERQWLIPDYHAPWQTEPAFFHPLFFLVARLCSAAGISIALGFHGAHFIGYCLTAFALRQVLRVFCGSRWEAWAAFGLMALTVPVQSQAILPLAWWSGLADRLPAWEFLEISNDGFFRGILQTVPRTYGTATLLFAMSLLGNYLRTGRRPHLWMAAGATVLGGIIHPYELVVIAGAGCLALLLRRRGSWLQAALDAALLGLAVAIAVVPYILMFLGRPWIRHGAAVFRSAHLPPELVLMLLGAPLILAAVLLPLRWRMGSPPDLLLQCWFGVTLVELYLPLQLSPKHLVGSFPYVIALLLVRQAAQTSQVLQSARAWPRLATAFIVFWCLLSMAPHVVFRVLCWREGARARPERLFSTVAPAEELAAIDWMRKHASPDHLVLAPRVHAPWFATVPMRSFASHPVFSITMDDQVEESDRFFGGSLSESDSNRFLSGYGFRFVVTPQGCACNRYLSGSLERARLGEWVIHEFPGRTMKPYPADHVLDPAARRRVRTALDDSPQ